MSQHEPQKHFFISYNKADKGWAEWVAWLLEQDGYSLTIQAWDSLPGTNFAVYMHNAIISSQRIIAILSDNYLNSLYTLPEWAAFFTDDPTGEKRLIIPVLVAECDSKKLGLLKSLSRIKLLGKEEAQAREELLEEIRKTLKGTGRPDTAPRFPGMVQTANDSSPAPRYPGTFPPIWNLTHQRNAFFTGREDLLDALESAQTNAITQAVAGLGGVGKTQTAVEYAYRNKERFDLVWWVNAEFATSLRSDLADLAFKLGLATQGATEQAEAIALALHYLRTCPTHWLLVLDNVEEPADIRPYLPNGGNGQTLITSRYNGDWGKSIKPLFAQIWGQSQSVQFLEKRTERSEAAFEELAQELGGLPLALEQAAAYMNAKSKSGESYLELFKKRRMELLKRSNAPEDYHNDTVATTWEISFKALGEANPAGAELLELCAWLGVAEIPFSLFLENAEELPERLEATAGDELDWDDAIGAIKRYSLAEVSGEGLTLHRLVGLALRTAQGTDTARLEQAAKLLWAAYPDVEFETWEDCGRLLEVGMAVAGYAEERGAALAAASYLYNQIALYLQNARADYRQALPLFQRALAISEKMLGSEHPTVAIRLINMGGLLREMGEYASALPLFQRALAIDEKALGAEHPDIATNLNHLGSLLQNMGEYASALPLYQRAIEIGEKTLGSEHPDVAVWYNNMGVLLKAMGEYASALPLYQRAIEIGEKTLGSEHPTVATRLNNLGSLLQDMGDLPSALPLYQRALAIREKQLGEFHPDVAQSLNNMGDLQRDMGEYASALPLFQRAIEIGEKTLGKEHPTVAARLINLGLLLQDMGEYASALPLYQRALAIDEKVLGAEHPDVSSSLNNLGSLLQAMGDLSSALPLFQRALVISEKTLGSDHPTVAIRLGNLGGLLRGMGQLQNALPLYQRSLAIHEKQLGEFHPYVAIGCYNLGSLLQDMGDYASALPLCQRALAIREKQLGEFHPDVAQNLNNLGLLLKDMGDLPAALPLLQRVLAIDEKALGAEHPDVVRDLNNLGVLRYKMGERAEAERLLSRALEICLKKFGSRHPDTQNTAEWLEEVRGSDAKQVGKQKFRKIKWQRGE